MKKDKIDLMRQMANEYKADAVLSYSPTWRKEGYRYLTRVNFFGPYGVVLYIAKNDKTFIFNSSVRDRDLAERSLKGLTGIQKMESGYQNLIRLLKQDGVAGLCVSGIGLIPADFSATLRLAGIDIKSGEGFLDKCRWRKTPEEVEFLRGAVHMADEAFTVFCQGVHDQLTEFEIVANVEYKLKSIGAEDNFMLIATGGVEVRGMTPPTMRRVEPGHLVRTELTPSNQGWYCQICRTVVCGKASDNQKRAFEIFKEAEEAGLAILKPGVNINDVAVAENDVFRKHGFGEYTTMRYTRVRGHGQGMYIDEAPTVNEGVDFEVQEGMVMVIHPNTYNPLCGYMVFGDPVVITKTGYEIITNTGRKLFEV
jgi:Xaa-Pro aminopeptidase